MRDDHPVDLAEPSRADELDDALKAFVDPDTDGRGALAWVYGEQQGPAAGVGVIVTLAASPFTSAAHRTLLVWALGRALETADTLPEPIRRYLIAHRHYLQRFVELLDERGPAPWRPLGVAALSARCGLTRAESTLLLAGLPVRDWDEAEFLSAEQRATLGLTAAEATVGRMELLTVQHSQRILLLDAALPEDPATLWDRGPDVNRLAEAWIEQQGRRIPVREDLITELGTVMGFPTDILRTFAAPSPGDWLHTDGECDTAGGTITTTATAGEPFSDRQLPSATAGMAWLGYHLPAADPIRLNLGRVYDLIRQRLRNPNLLIGTVLLDPDQAPADDILGAVAGHRLHGKICYHLRPAFISGPDDPALDVVPDHSPISIRLMLDPAFDRMITTLEPSGLPPGTYAQNALRSAPHLVEQLADRYGLDAAAASLYLQLLALPDPSDSNIRRWNNWDDAQLRQIGAALLCAGLVIEDARPTAGRELFLPGPWLVRRFAPAFEAWKSPLYGFAPDQEPPYRWTLVSRPVTELFQAAADRVCAGDVPH